MVGVRVVIQGGDYTQILDTDTWIASTDDSNFWRVVEVTEVVSVVNLLPEPKRSVVKKLMVPQVFFPFDYFLSLVSANLP